MSRRNQSNNPNEKSYGFNNNNHHPFTDRRSVTIETPSENKTADSYDDSIFPPVSERTQSNTENPDAHSYDVLFRNNIKTHYPDNTHSANSSAFAASKESNSGSDNANDIQKNAAANYESIQEELIAQAEREAQRIKENASREAAEIRNRANSEASAIRRSAQTEAEAIKYAAHQETGEKIKELEKKELELIFRASELERKKNELAAEKDKQTREFNNMIAQAKALGDNLVNQGQARKDELIAEGEFQKKQIIDSVKAEAIKEAKENGLREYFSAENKTQEEKRKELNDLYNEISESNSALTKQLANEAFSLAYEMNSSLNESIAFLNDHLQQVLAVQNNVSTTLDKWQRGLYTKQLSPLCTSYETIGRLIATHEGNLAKYQVGSADPVNAAKVEVLVPIIKTLKTFREQLGRALAPLGISVYYPEAGEGFDPNFHSVEDVYAIPDMLIDHPITECIRPGFIKAGYENEPQAVLVKAVVEVETQSPKF